MYNQNPKLCNKDDNGIGKNCNERAEAAEALQEVWQVERLASLELQGIQFACPTDQTRGHQRTGWRTYKHLNIILQWKYLQK